MKNLPLALTALSLFTIQSVQADSAKLVNPANNHSYQRFDTAKTWTQAKDACANQGGYLATITSKVENDWIRGNILQGSVYTLLGGSDAQIEGTWTWITGEAFDYSNWNLGEPNNGAGGSAQQYNAIYSNGTWDDAWGDYQSSYLCEWNTSTPVLKQSWTIPAVHYCSADVVNTTARKLTATTCFNNINGAMIRVWDMGDKTRMSIWLNPTNQSGSFFFKMTFPSELRVSDLKITNSEPIPAQQGSEVADTLSLTGGEVLSKILGQFNFPIQLLATLYPINTVGDPSFLKLLPPDSVLSKELYPYQTLERHFQRTYPTVAIAIAVDSNVPFAKFKTVMDLQKIGFYIGSDINNELLIDKLRSK